MYLLFLASGQVHLSFDGNLIRSIVCSTYETKMTLFIYFAIQVQFFVSLAQINTSSDSVQDWRNSIHRCSLSFKHRTLLRLNKMELCNFIRTTEYSGGSHLESLFFESAFDSDTKCELLDKEFRRNQQKFYTGNCLCSVSGFV